MLIISALSEAASQFNPGGGSRVGVEVGEED